MLRKDRAVKESHTEEHGYLALEGLPLEPRLARRLPAELAWRFHVLPLAQHHGRLTVAMANPDDPAARQAIAAALGPAACVVQCDAKAIDSLLAQIWGEQVEQPVEMLACAFPDPISPPVADYAQALRDLLGARLEWLNTAGGMRRLATQAGSREHDLYLFQDPGHPLLGRLFLAGNGVRGQGRESHLSPAALVVGRPRWPITKILFILSGKENDCATVDWVLRLAHRAGSRVTVLATVPPVPAMYGHRPGISDGLPALLTANSPLGQQMRQIARHLVAWEIEATLRLRTGTAEVQVRREVDEGDYDLIAVTNPPCPGWQRRFRDRLADDLLGWTDRPVLVVRPTQA